MSNQLCSVNSMPVTVNDVVNYMKITGSYHNARRAVVMNEVIRDHASHSGLKIEDDTLQVYSDLRRMQLDLHNSSEMKNYLEQLGVSIDEWEEVLENELYREMIKNKFGNQIFVLDAWRLIKGIPAVRNHMAHAIVSKAGEHGIDVSEDELQDASDTFRRLMGMHNSDEFKAILQSLRMTEEDWEKNVHANVSINKMDTQDVEKIINNEIKNALMEFPFLHNMISDMVFGSIIHAKAKSKDVKVSEDEVQEFFDNFRRAMKLHTAKSFNTWLAASGLSFDEFEYMIETELLKRKFAEKGIELIDHTKIDHYMKVSESFTFAFNKVKTFFGLKKIAMDKGVTVSDGDVVEESDMLRRSKGMHGKDAFKEYLDSHELTVEDWENYCEIAAYIRKLYDQETTIDKIEQHLEDDRQFLNIVKDFAFDRYIGKTASGFNIKF